MTRTSGTNIFSYTLDLYETDEWKIVIGADWTVGTVSAKTSGLSIVDNGVTWTRDEALEFVVPDGANTITVDDNNGGLNFETVVDGNYTITLVSSTPLSKSLTILRNGNPLVAPPAVTYPLPEWRVFKNDWEGSAASHEAVDGELVMTVENGNFSTDPALNWKLQIIQDGHVPTLGGPDNSGYLQLESGKTYKVSFDARASVAGKFTLAIGHPAGGFTSYHTDALLEVTTTMQKLTSEFTLPADGDFSVLAQFKLEMGNLFAGAAIGSTFVLDNVLIEEKVGDTFVATELILNGAMDEIVYFTSYSIVGDATLAGWTNNAEGFALAYDDETGEYSFDGLVLTAGLFRLLETGKWGGNIGFSKLTTVPTGFTDQGSDDNIEVSAEGAGTYNISLVFVDDVAELTLTKVA
jgi:hypothetical protein